MGTKKKSSVKKSSVKKSTAKRKSTTPKVAAPKIASPKVETIASESKPVANGRSSPEAINKRRVARALNTLFTKPAATKPDGRVERRRMRVIAELKERTGPKAKDPLSVIQILQYVDYLLGVGESDKHVRKLVRSRDVIAKELSADQGLVDEVHAAYKFSPGTYQTFGVQPTVVSE